MLCTHESAIQEDLHPHSPWTSTPNIIPFSSVNSSKRKNSRYIFLEGEDSQSKKVVFPSTHFRQHFFFYFSLSFPKLFQRFSNRYQHPSFCLLTYQHTILFLCQLFVTRIFVLVQNHQTSKSFSPYLDLTVPLLSLFPLGSRKWKIFKRLKDHVDLEILLLLPFTFSLPSFSLFSTLKSTTNSLSAPQFFVVD